MVRDLSVEHAVRSAGTALAGLKDLDDQPPDLVVLDLGLPDLDGLQTLQLIRSRSDVPVLVATARDEESHIARTLRNGADDYVVKPFSGELLRARVLALLRRSALAGQAEHHLSVGDLVVDVHRRTVTVGGTAVRLTRREFDLLAYLARHAGRVVPREELLTEVWREAYRDSQTIDVHLSGLRRKLGERGAAPRHLHTVRGVGVMLDDPGGAGPPP